MIMKKSLFAVWLCISMIALFCVTCRAGEKTCHWYAKRNSTHTQPILESQFDFVNRYNAVYVGKDKNAKRLYLTFDAGYENGNVEKILDVLKEENVPAAFFVLSHLVEANTPLIERMQNEGHLVCNHTAKHKDMTTVSREEFEQEIHAMESLVEEKTGKPIAQYYRPPMGTFNEDNLKWADELGYCTVFWSLCYADWDNQKQPTPAYAKDLLLKYTHPGAIVLLHPTSSTNAAILRDLIASWREQGYEFASLDEMK